MSDTPSTFFEIIQTLDMPCVYGVFRKNQALPYMSYTGYGQDIFWADNGGYHRVNLYQLVYYFSEKDEALEDSIETLLLSYGYTYNKGEDLYDSEQNVYYIIYDSIKALGKGL